MRWLGHILHMEDDSPKNALRLETMGGQSKPAIGLHNWRDHAKDIRDWRNFVFRTKITHRTAINRIKIFHFHIGYFGK